MYVRVKHDYFEIMGFTSHVTMRGFLSVKVTAKSENRNRGIRKGRMPRSILRKTETFYYILGDLRLQAV